MLLFGSLLTIMATFLYTNDIAMAQYPDFFAGREIAGKSLDKLAQEYWHWWFHVLKDDETKAVRECFIGEDSENNTKFLFNPYAQVNYNTKCGFIYSNQSIIVPLIVGQCDNTLPRNPNYHFNTIEGYWACGYFTNEDFINWRVTLDGEVIFSNSVNPNLKKDILVRNSPLFNLTVVEPNRYDVPGGIYESIVDGYYLPLKPLPTGEHILTYEASRKVSSASHDPPLKGVAKYTFTVKDVS
jgi:hypothetical protein